jgi:hypothetical protein
LLLRVRGQALPLAGIRYIVALVLVGFGIFFLLRQHYHRRWVRMQVGFRDLTIWSFPMASALSTQWISANRTD